MKTTASRPKPGTISAPAQARAAATTTDRRPAAVTQRQLAGLAGDSPALAGQRALRDGVNGSARMRAQAAQLRALRPGAAPLQLMDNGTAPDDRNWWTGNAPYLLGGRAVADQRNYFQRILPMGLGGRPVPLPVASVAPPEQDDAKVEPAKKLTNKEVKALLARQAKARAKEERKERLESEARERRERPAVVEEPEAEVEPVLPVKKEAPKKMSLKEKREAKAARELLAQQQERQRALAAMRALPREVTRHDRNFDSQTNRGGQGKSHRTMADELHPAGNHPITAGGQLDQASAHKGTSDRTSFIGPGAGNAQDYSAGGVRASVGFKYRKHKRATLKGKQDALGFESFSVAEVLDQVRHGPGGAEDKKMATAYARKDQEYQVKGAIPARFLRWSDRPPSTLLDSDSDNSDSD